jgi:hypothetical protein
MITAEEIPSLFTAFRARWTLRDERTLLMNAVVAGDWSVTGPADDALENRSPNMIQVALEDTAEAASLVPTVRVVPSGGSESKKKMANAMERIAISYLDMSQIEMLEIKSLLDLAAFGYFVWVVNFDRESGAPVIEWRDPRTCYPETGFSTMDSVRTAMFARDMYVRQLPPEHRDKVREAIYLKYGKSLNDVQFHDSKVSILEVYEEDCITMAAVYTSNSQALKPSDQYCPVILEQTPTAGRICPVVIGQRPTLDSEPRGQFDQVVGVLQAHVRLMAMVLDYSDQAVYSDIWVKDLVGQMPYGGGAVIQLGPTGAIGRVQPAVSSLQVSQELDQLITNIHVGGRWPKTRPGEIDQAIASAKFVEATAGMMNTVIRTMHLVMKRALEQALRIAFKTDVELGAERTVSGVLRNQQFLETRKKTDIDLEAKIRVDYGIGLGRDPAQTMVLGIQGMQTGLFSKEYVQENFEGLTDVARERERIDIEQFRDMAMAQLLQGLQEKTIPQTALIAIARARSTGADIFELFEKFIVKPAEEQAAQMIQPGMGGAPLMPGMTDPNAMPPGGGMPPPAAPGGADLLAGMLGGGGPPQETSTIARNSIPVGGPGGGFLGTQTVG